MIHGLWGNRRGLRQWIQIMKTNRINAVRLPFSISMIVDQRRVTSYVHTPLNPGLSRGMSSLTALDRVIQAFAEQNILVMLDYHLANPDDGVEPLWSNRIYTEKVVIDTWKSLARRYCNSAAYWNVYAADLKNEPYEAEWGTGSSKDWRLGAQRIGNAILEICPRWLIFVEGVAKAPGSFWGSDFTKFLQFPVCLSHPSNLVLSPHLYGPTVGKQTYFTDPTFSNMPAIWDRQVGWIAQATGKAMIMGEWGSFYTEDVETYPLDKPWMDAFTTWLSGRGFAMGFYWTMPPQSIDTGGLIQNDLYSIWQDKFNTFKKFQCSSVESIKAITPPPTPSPVTGFSVCIDSGSFSNTTNTISGVRWIGDRYFNKGNVASNGNQPITGPGVAGAQSVFQTIRWDDQFTYTIPVPGPGRYTVTMYFIENSRTAPRQRIMSVQDMCGRNLVSNLDVFASAGAQNALVTRSVPYVLSTFE
eukprot:CAMPEP_0184668426 /NCGR_PEP_ID=MMETSP0308-20130426/72284_1 /TAXON_ID=38269 /ORGANISM="Gloeochaete witrockiana, Strain SAG 46.84" /LENGTH=470 /DNA_ID=CAMNT_0027114133 /DNA_START=150 /DNA_END=1559 /DNA_ORIENTATION=+